MTLELWSLKEKCSYPEYNTKIITIGNVKILATLKGEPLVTRVI